MAVDVGLKVVLGMTLSYLASLAGMFFAWYHYRKRQREAEQKEKAPRREDA